MKQNGITRLLQALRQTLSRAGLLSCYGDTTFALAF
jgi:hypothetical protein